VLSMLLQANLSPMAEPLQASRLKQKIKWALWSLSEAGMSLWLTSGRRNWGVNVRQYFAYFLKLSSLNLWFWMNNTDCDLYRCSSSWSLGRLSCGWWETRDRHEPTECEEHGKGCPRNLWEAMSKQERKSWGSSLVDKVVSLSVKSEYLRKFAWTLAWTYQIFFY
jgi:hypothetical protein